MIKWFRTPVKRSTLITTAVLLLIAAAFGAGALFVAASIPKAAGTPRPMAPVTLTDGPAQEGVAYFECADGTRMYVDHHLREWWVEDGPVHEAHETDPAYAAAYQKCNPNIRP